MPRRQDQTDPLLASNRKAFRDYEILERFEAGIRLVGTEVKSCRARAIQLADGYAYVKNGRLFLANVHIAPYEFGNVYNHAAKQERELLMHKREILKLAQWLAVKGGTIVPLRFYLKNALVKVEIAYCRGKTHADQREDLKKRESDREIRRALKK
ncbi:MAG: SsrA-binding protein SmpB [Victivallaceae bacterium]|nr:SsrA-binding protein SmpB [Victivallaceae bacterium]